MRTEDEVARKLTWLRAQREQLENRRLDTAALMIKKEIKLLEWVLN